MKTYLTLIANVILVATSFGMDQPQFIISKVVDSPTPDTKEMILKFGDSSKTLLVDRNVLISEAQVASASLVVGEPTRIRIDLTKEGKKKFAEITKDSIGNRLAIQFGGQLVVAPIIMSEITTGFLEITGNIPKELAEKIVATLNKNKRANPALQPTATRADAGVCG